MSSPVKGKERDPTSMSAIHSDSDHGSLDSSGLCSGPISPAGAVCKGDVKAPPVPKAAEKKLLAPIPHYLECAPDGKKCSNQQFSVNFCQFSTSADS